jgi:hypothetical protein
VRLVLCLSRCGLSFVGFGGWVFFFAGHDVILSQVFP